MGGGLRDAQVELHSRIGTSISELQGMGDKALTSECLNLDTLQECLVTAGWRSPSQVSTMSLDDMRNTVIVRVEMGRSITVGDRHLEAPVVIRSS